MSSIPTSYPRPWPCPLLLAGCLLFFTTSVFAQNPTRYTLSGYVSDAESGERLIGATVLVRAGGQGTVTNTFGFYSLTLPAADSVQLAISYVGYQPDFRTLPLRENQVANIALSPSALLQMTHRVGFSRFTSASTPAPFANRHEGVDQSGASGLHITVAHAQTVTCRAA